jgi:hypothetical protein
MHKDKWQEQAEKFVQQAQHALWHGANQRPLEWLRHQGYRDTTIRHARLGYHPGKGENGDRCFVQRAAWGLPESISESPDRRTVTRFWIPRGIVLPSFFGREMTDITIHRPLPPDCWQRNWQMHKHIEIADTVARRVFDCFLEHDGFTSVQRIVNTLDMPEEDVRPALKTLEDRFLIFCPQKRYWLPGEKSSLFNLQTVERGKPVMLLESPWDALAVHQAAGDLIAAIAPDTKGKCDERWVPFVQSATGMLMMRRDDTYRRKESWYFWNRVLVRKLRDWPLPVPEIDTLITQKPRDIRAWALQGALQVWQPDPPLAERLIDQAMDDDDIALVRALADYHPHAWGVRLFLRRFDEAEAEEVAGA